MNKKDRIAVVVTTLALFFGGIAALGDEGITILWVSIFTVVYWANRFIKNAISFFRVKDE